MGTEDLSSGKILLEQSKNKEKNGSVRESKLADEKLVTEENFAVRKNEIIEEDKIDENEIVAPPKGSWRYQYFWLFLTFILLSVDAVLGYYYFLKPPLAPIIVEEVNEVGPPDGMVASSLNGEYIDKFEVELRPFAVMIDNFVTARPSSGLNAASVVWETLVEGGVTRLMAIFQTSDEVTIGPVRSAREYFLPWVEAHDAVYVHSGGSPKALGLLSDSKVIDNADEFAYGSAYFRRANLKMPHNLFTTTKRLRTLAVNNKWQRPPKLEPWEAGGDLPSGAEEAKLIAVRFSTPPYRVRWRWDEEKELYRRSVAGIVANDGETLAAITTKNVIILFVEISPAPRLNVPDAVNVETVGFGEAWFFRDGVVTKGEWKKKSAAERTRFTYSDNQPYLLQRGPVWIEVVSADVPDNVTFE